MNDKGEDMDVDCDIIQTGQSKSPSKLLNKNVPWYVIF